MVLNVLVRLLETGYWLTLRKMAFAYPFNLIWSVQKLTVYQQLTLSLNLAKTELETCSKPQAFIKLSLSITNKLSVFTQKRLSEYT